MEHVGIIPAVNKPQWLPYAAQAGDQLTQLHLSGHRWRTPPQCLPGLLNGVGRRLHWLQLWPRLSLAWL